MDEPITVIHFGCTVYEIRTNAAGQLYHAPCGRWFDKFKSDGGFGSRFTWFEHRCEGLAPQVVMNPQVVQWRALADAVRAQSARLT